MTDGTRLHDDETDAVVAAERPELLIVCGLLGVIGPLAMTVGTIVMGAVVPGYDWMSETISDLSNGPLTLWTDAFWYANAAGMIALSLASAHAHLGRWAWSVGIFALALISMVVVMLALWDDLTPGPTEDMTVHVKLSVLLLPLFLVGPLAMAEGIRRVSEVYRWMFYAAGVLWTVSAVAFWFSPTEIDGMVERIAGSVTLLWTVPLGLYFLHRGRRRLSR